MSLPTIVAPNYELTVPSTGKKIKFRPFLVKEEKILLLANETKDQDQILSAMKQIVSNCTFNEVDPEEAATFDIEYIFLQLRAKSVGESVEVNIKCTKCDTPIPVRVELSEIQVIKEKNHTNKIAISDTMGLVMRYPNFKALQILQSSGGNAQNPTELLEFVATCITSIYDNSQIYEGKEHTTNELVEFIENLPQGAFAKIMDFFTKMPVVSKDIVCECSKCKAVNKVTLKGAQDFFQ